MATAPIVDNGVAADAPTYSEVEQIAMDKGWKPRDQFKGNDGEWSDAPTFLRKMPGTRDLKRELSDMKRSIEGITRAADKQVKREVEERTKEIEANLRAATKAGDENGVIKAVNDFRQLEQEQRQTTGDDPEARFASENAWYGKNDDATAYAVSVSAREARKGASVDAQLKAASDAVRKRFPELFDDGGAGDESERVKPRTPMLHTPGRSVGRTAGTTFSDMPDAARRAADRTYEQMKTRNGDKVPDRKAFDAQYAKDFFAED